MNRLTWQKRIATHTSLALVGCFFTLAAYAVSPAPDGGYAGNNTAEGSSALFSLSSGIDNSGLGFQVLYHDTTGYYNTGIGYRALFSNTTGGYNTGTGVNALYNNSTGAYNTGDGVNALYRNTIGQNNTANGALALFYNIIGSGNSAFGSGALENNIADGNTAVGNQALTNNTTAVQNTAVGFQALASNINYGENTAVGFRALWHSTSGGLNTAVGNEALESASTGGGNTAVGHGALSSNTTGVGNIAIGQVAGENVTTANFVICIGAAGNNVDNSCYVDNIFGATSSNGVGVFVNSNGRLGTMTSSRRFKEEIKPMDQASKALFSLKPVSFRYKKGTDPEGTQAVQFGLVAEDVEKVSPNLVVRDREGKPYSVRYEAVNAMLLNEFLKEHRIVQEQGAMIAQQEKQIEALTAGLQKVSAQLALTKAVPQAVRNP